MCFVSIAFSIRKSNRLLTILSDIDKEHQIRQRSGSNDSATWTDGPINGANLAAFDGDLAGLNVCWAGIDNTLTMRLWYASSNTSFEEYLYNNEEREWNWQKRWDGFSGAAGVGCVTDPDHPNIYVAFVNLQGSVEIHWRTRKDAHLSTAGWEKYNTQTFPFPFPHAHKITDKVSSPRSGSNNPRRVPRVVHHAERQQDRRADNLRRRRNRLDCQHELGRQGHRSRFSGSDRPP